MTSISQEGGAGEFGVPTVTLRGSKDSQRHPWIYRRMLRSPPPGLSDGDEVVVVGADGVPLGRGFYHASSTIAVRMITSLADTPIDAEFLRHRIAEAIELRRDVLKLDRVTDAYRVVHGEADGLSGLIVDRYGPLLVVELHAKAFLLRRELVRAVLADLVPDSRVCFKVGRAAAQLEGIDAVGVLDAELSPSEEVEIHEGKMRFVVTPSGHKTGFFLDQREHRERFARVVRDRKVLDSFSYTGGFAIAARTLGKARRVVAIDFDEEAVSMARRNAALNHAEVEWLQGDAIVYLRNQQHATERFDAIVVDPPKWAGSRGEIESAHRRYRDVNLYACRAIAPGGVLVTCSCSGLVSEEVFLGLLRYSASLAQRRLQVFHVGGAGPDHPVSLEFPESRYLKVVHARVL